MHRNKGHNTVDLRMYVGAQLHNDPAFTLYYSLLDFFDRYEWEYLLVS